MMNIAHLHWLLDMAVEYPPPLEYFLPHVRNEHLNAREIPGFQVNDYAELIESALEKGLLQLVHCERNIDLLEARSVVSRHARGLWSKSDGRFNLLMTTLGGEAWERMANPQWDRFLYFSCLLPDNELRVSATIASRNSDVVMAYLGWFDRLESVDVNWETLRIETYSNYAATYWKRLNGVHEVTIDGIYHLPERYAPKFVSDWVHSLSNWRLRPWERPDWLSEPVR
jgi:hypothetical protein